MDTVQDNRTGLIWQRASSETMTRSDALNYCSGLSLAGTSDWRLPTINELLSIVDDTRSFPAIDPSAFPSTESDHFWTSSPLASASEIGAWYVHFSYGTSGYSNTSSAYRVRCVR
jgi:hypothetical protein